MSESDVGYWHRQAVDDLTQLRAELQQTRQRAERAETDAEDFLERALRAEADRERIEAQARGWKAEADEAKTQRETWEENHQILVEHFRRMTERAETAEQSLAYRDRDARHTGAELTAVSSSWDELKNECDELREHNEQIEYDRAHWWRQAQSSQRDAEQAGTRADTWFELSKALMRALLASPHEESRKGSP